MGNDAEEESYMYANTDKFNIHMMICPSVIQSTKPYSKLTRNKQLRIRMHLIMSVLFYEQSQCERERTNPNRVLKKVQYDTRTLSQGSETHGMLEHVMLPQCS